MDNYLFVGPSGSGKTYRAKEKVVQLFAQNNRKMFRDLFSVPKGVTLKSFIDKQDVNTIFGMLRQKCPKRIVLISLHEGYSYSDLIEGISLDVDGGESKWLLKSKILKETIEYSTLNDEDCYIVFDDLDRVDIQGVIGDFTYAMNHLDEEITLLYGSNLKITNNVHFMGTFGNIFQTNSFTQSFYKAFNIVIIEDPKDDEINDIFDSYYAEGMDKAYFNSQKDKIISLYKKYRKMVEDNLSFEHRELKEGYPLGISYFLPRINTDVSDIELVCKNKIHHQVRPLLIQYIEDGITSEEALPPVAWTYTLFTRDRDEVVEPHIQIEYDKREDKTNKKTMSYYAHQMFERGKYLKGSTTSSIKIGNGGINRGYLMVFAIMEDIINHSLINDYELIDMWVSDPTISFATGKGGETGCLIRKKKDNFIINDPVGKNSNNQTHYDYHVLKYDHVEYLVEGRFNYTANSLKKEISACYSSLNSNNEKVNPYRTLKVLVYRYLSRYRDLLKDYLNSDDCNNKATVQGEIDALEVDIKKVELLTFDKKHAGQPGFIQFETNKTESIAFYKIVNYIRNLPTWQAMINGTLKGVYKRMDPNYMRIMELTGIRQMILQGPPGTSKTYTAKKILVEQCGITLGEKQEVGSKEIREKLNDHRLILNQDTNQYSLPTLDSSRKEKEAYWDMIQFHPSYTYEDFVRGITVNTQKDKRQKGEILENGAQKYSFLFDAGISYTVVNKIFGKMCDLACNYPKKRFFLVVDEINRANLATVFGELIYALEYRGEPVSTPYIPDNGERNQNLTVPENLFIIGTMNTADKSIGGIDYAIRRRFLFYPVLPDSNIVYSKVNGDSDAPELKLFYLVEKIFDQCLNKSDFHAEDVQIGHTYFLRNSDDQNALDVMKYKFFTQIMPIIKEYVKDGVLVDRELRKIYDGKFSSLLQNANDIQDASYKELIDAIASDDGYKERVAEYKKKLENANDGK